MQKFKKDKALSAIFKRFSHTHHGINALNLGFVKHGGAANSVWQVFADKQCVATRQIRLGKCGEMGGACGRNGQSENGAVFGRGTSLSLSLSLVARTF